MPEISDAQLELANKYQTLYNKLWNDPKEGLAFKRKVKELVPEAQIPELDMIDTTVKPFEEKMAKQAEENKALKDRLDNIEKRSKDEKEESDLVKSLDSARKKFHLTDEGFDKAVARMKEMNNPDAEAAAAWVASQEKKARPVGSSSFAPSALNLYGSNKVDESMADLHRDPIAWQDATIQTMLDEFAAQEAA